MADITLPSGFADYFHETSGYAQGVDVPGPYAPPGQPGVTAAYYATPSAGVEQLQVLLIEKPDRTVDDALATAEDVQDFGDAIVCGADGGDPAKPTCGVQLTDGVLTFAVSTDFADMDPRGVPTSPEELAALVQEFLTVATEGEPAPVAASLSDSAAADVVLPAQLGVVYAHVGSSDVAAPPNAIAFGDYGLSGIPQFEAAVFPGVTADAVKADLTDIQVIRGVECGTNAGNGFAVCVVPLAVGVLVVNDSVMQMKNVDASSRFTAALLYEMREPNPNQL